MPDARASLFHDPDLRVALHPDVAPNGARSKVTRRTKVSFTCQSCGDFVVAGQPSVAINTLWWTRICVPCAEAHRV